MPNLDFTPISDALVNADIHSNELLRVFHGRGHTIAELSHINVDFYPPYLFISAYEPLCESQLAQLTTVLVDTLSTNWPEAITGMIYQHRAGQQTQTSILMGEDPGAFVIQELGVKYQVELTRHQNTGIFPDMREGRQFVMDHAKHANVLNLFSYTCGFSVAAMKGGADRVVNMDMNKGVLRVGKINHQLNDVDRNVSYLPHDILKSFGKLKKMGPYDLVVVDPPSFQKGSFVLTKDYQKIIRRVPELLAGNAHVLFCANSPELSEQAFKQLIDEHCDSRLTFLQRLAPAPNFIEVDTDRSLKALVYTNT